MEKINVAEQLEVDIQEGFNLALKKFADRTGSKVDYLIIDGFEVTPVCDGSMDFDWMISAKLRRDDNL